MAVLYCEVKLYQVPRAFRLVIFMLHKCWFDTLILELLLLKQLHLCLMGCSALELAIITWVLSIFQQILPPEFQNTPLLFPRHFQTFSEPVSG